MAVNVRLTDFSGLPPAVTAAKDADETAGRVSAVKAAVLIASPPTVAPPVDKFPTGDDLTDAITKNDYARLEGYLKRGVYIHSLDASGRLPLNVAARLGQLDMIRLMVKTYEANIDLKDRNGDSPLMAAVEGRQLEAAKLLIALGSSKDDLEVKNDDKMTPLTRAAENGDVVLVDILCVLGADVNARDGTGQTALTRAVANNDLEMVKVLKKHNADPNISNTQDTPLLIAICNDFENVFDYLVDEMHADLNLPSHDSVLPLEYAMFEKCNGWDEKLKGAGADVELFDEWMDRKAVAHIWGLSGTSTITRKDGKEFTFSLTGLSRTMAPVLLGIHLKDFFEEYDTVTSDQEAEMLQAVQDAIFPLKDDTDEEVAARMCASKPVAIFGGSDNGKTAHSMAFIVAGNRLYVCNRGEGLDEEYSVRTYALDPSLQTADLVKKLRTIYPSMEDVNQMIAGLNLTPFKDESIKMKPQKVGNCVWSSTAKNCVRVLFGHYKLTADFYKQFSAYARKNTLKLYLGASKTPDLVLINTIGAKLKSKVETGKDYYEEFFDSALLKQLSDVTGEDYLSLVRV